MTPRTARTAYSHVPLVAALALLVACTNVAPPEPQPTPLVLTGVVPRSGTTGTALTTNGTGIAGDASVALCGINVPGAVVADGSGSAIAATETGGVHIALVVPDLGDVPTDCDVAVVQRGGAAVLSDAFAFVPTEADTDPDPDPEPESDPDPDPEAGPGTWTALAPAPVARQEVSFVALHGLLYLTGGTSRMEAYRPETDTWTLLTPFPGPTTLDHMQATAVRGKLYYLGGLNANQWPAEVGTAYVFDPTAEPALGGPLGGNPWTALAGMGARGRGAGGVAEFEGRLYYAGGIRGGQAVDFFDVYDPVSDAWTPLPAMPHARDHFHAAVVDRRFYAIGGRDFDFDANLPQVDVYDFDTGSWSTLATSLPTPRGGFGVAVLGREILVIGGEGKVGSEELAYAKVEAYDTLAGTWRTLADLPTARHGIQATVCDGAVYVAAGGRALGGGWTTNVLERFHLGENPPGACATQAPAPVAIDWSTTTAAAFARAEAQGAAIDDTLYVLGGFAGGWGAYT